MYWWYWWWLHSVRVASGATMAAYTHAGTGVYGRRRPNRDQEEYMIEELRRDLEELGVEGLKRGI